MAKVLLLMFLLCVTGCATVPLADNQYELTESFSPKILAGVLSFTIQSSMESWCLSQNKNDLSCYQNVSGGNEQNGPGSNEEGNEWASLEERALKICKGYTVVDRISSSYLIATKRKLIIKCPVE